MMSSSFPVPLCVATRTPQPQTMDNKSGALQGVAHTLKSKLATSKIDYKILYWSRPKCIIKICNGHVLRVFCDSSGDLECFADGGGGKALSLFLSLTHTLTHIGLFLSHTQTHTHWSLSRSRGPGVLHGRREWQSPPQSLYPLRWPLEPLNPKPFRCRTVGYDPSIKCQLASLN